MNKKNGLCFILDGHVIRNYIEGKDDTIDEMFVHEIEFYKDNKKIKIITPIQAFLFALFTSKKIDGERLKRLVDRTSFNLVTMVDGKPRVTEFDTLRDEK
jgi:hypothetical protein